MQLFLLAQDHGHSCWCTAAEQQRCLIAEEHLVHGALIPGAGFLMAVAREVLTTVRGTLALHHPSISSCY